ncbi:DUF3253 domain-containing protein [Streptomyces sp. ODS05-4]|uniref:DUF3253 domain-containing protein n=1 Tax=Streptomyces sp. ODS05-4 TaxID=2944939 RepID=UPI00210D667D|nr:DUF3253 domain-containing protein [Streptomyces sp. ODS05-4]
MTRRDTEPGEELEQTVLRLLDARAKTATICPSDAARAAYSGDDEGWRDLMDPVRDAVRRLAAAGQVEVVQHGEPVDLDAARGPVRIRRTGG